MGASFRLGRPLNSHPIAVFDSGLGGLTVLHALRARLPHEDFFYFADTRYLPYGDLPSLKLNRNPRKEFDQRIELWLAPSLDYLPVRLRITNANGDSVDQLLRSLEKPGS